MTEKIVKLEDIPQQQLKDLLDFPCPFTFKVVGKNRPDLVDDTLVVIQRYAKGDYNPRQHISSKGTYNSVSVDIVAENIEQVETLYQELAKIDGVRMVL
ncbi:DUF493 family protein YbeD [Caviibacterium pharyngocola]|uniref:UPF0250 protein CVP04_05450 n=1 Tax=Caviibacterium pharyngocola TaxID=28159 RepID=A0A2M8RVB2_9PAST|nr:DUF493 family protein YbeD [Caviibacterium pharyngocola]PJG82815.1 hypothetical protein CVP04_05450 [Caviibacterium pharyngocola]